MQGTLNSEIVRTKTRIKDEIRAGFKSGMIIRIITFLPGAITRPASSIEGLIPARPLEMIIIDSGVNVMLRIKITPAVL